MSVSVSTLDLTAPATLQNDGYTLQEHSGTLEHVVRHFMTNLPEAHRSKYTIMVGGESILYRRDIEMIYWRLDFPRG